MSRLTNGQIGEAFARLTQLKDEVAARQAEITKIEVALAAAIPANSARSGVYHGVAKPGKSVSWAKAAENIVHDLVPKSKAAEVEKIVAFWTKETKPRQWFEVAK